MFPSISKEGSSEYSSSKFSTTLSVYRKKKVGGSFISNKIPLHKESRIVLKLELNLRAVQFKALLLQMIEAEFQG